MNATIGKMIEAWETCLRRTMRATDLTPAPTGWQGGVQSLTTPPPYARAILTRGFFLGNVEVSGGFGRLGGLGVIGKGRRACLAVKPSERSRKINGLPFVFAGVTWFARGFGVLGDRRRGILELPGGLTYEAPWVMLGTGEEVTSRRSICTSETLGRWLNLSGDRVILLSGQVAHD